MRSRLELDAKLREILGSCNVYYQPPPSLMMKYPCIRYSLDNITSDYANNKKYQKYKHYKITVIDTVPDNDVIEKLLDLEFSEYDRHFVSDGLDHTIIDLYY